jgi:hypothetical protein
MIITLKKLFAPLALVAIVACPLTSQAQVRRTSSINRREREQQERIRQGERSGELTRREAARLEAEQARIRVNEAYARRSGGELTPQERARLEKELNKSSKDIYQQKHDRQENERREERRERRHD